MGGAYPRFFVNLFLREPKENSPTKGEVRLFSKRVTTRLGKGFTSRLHHEYFTQLWAFEKRQNAFYFQIVPTCFF
jgi:hypothetical protein